MAPVTLGYFYLVSQIVLSVSFGHVMKWSGRRHCNVAVVAAINYAFAALLSYVIALQGRPPALAPEILVPGVLGGIGYVTTFFIYFEVIRLVGLSISTTVTRLAVMPAVLASVFYWHEQLTPFQAGGVILALLALPLLTAQPGDKTVKLAGPRWMWLVGMFALSSLGPVMLKFFREASTPEAKPLMLAIWFGAAAACAVPVLAVRRTVPRKRDFLPGILLGVLNLLINLSLLGALEQLPGALVFPVTSAGGVLLATVSSAGIWRERLNRLALSGVAVSILALVFINS